jgi:Flp pilus assembly protein TadB
LSSSRVLCPVFCLSSSCVLCFVCLRHVSSGLFVFVLCLAFFWSSSCFFCFDKTQDEEKQNTRHRTKTNKTEETGRRPKKGKTQDEDKQTRRHRTKTNKAQDTGRRKTKHRTQDTGGRQTKHKTQDEDSSSCVLCFVCPRPVSCAFFVFVLCLVFCLSSSCVLCFVCLPPVSCVLCTGPRQTKQKTQDEEKQSTRHRTKTNKTQDTGQRKTKHKTQDEDKQNTRHRTKTNKTQDTEHGRCLVFCFSLSCVLCFVCLRPVFCALFFFVLCLLFCLSSSCVLCFVFFVLTRHRTKKNKTQDTG